MAQVRPGRPKIILLEVPAGPGRVPQYRDHHRQLGLASGKHVRWTSRTKTVASLMRPALTAPERVAVCAPDQGKELPHTMIGAYLGQHLVQAAGRERHVS